MAPPRGTPGPVAVVGVVGAQPGPDVAHGAAVAAVLLGADLAPSYLPVPGEAVHFGLRVIDGAEGSGRVSHRRCPS